MPFGVAAAAIAPVAGSVIGGLASGGGSAAQQQQQMLQGGSHIQFGRQNGITAAPGSNPGQEAIGQSIPNSLVQVLQKMGLLTPPQQGQQLQTMANQAQQQQAFQAQQQALNNSLMFGGAPQQQQTTGQLPPAYPTNYGGS